MNSYLDKYLIEDTATVLAALQKIDNNHKGFLVIVSGDIFLGTLTDGDIRRALIKGKKVSDDVSGIYTKNSVALDVNCSISEAIDILSGSRVMFLPIVSNDGKIVNILTKKQLETALMLNLQIELDSDFSIFDENMLDHEIVRKPWGFYKTTILNSFYQSKVLSLEPNSSISLQRHKFREEYWLTVYGNGEAQIGDSIVRLNSGSYIFLPKGCKHRLRNTSCESNLVVVEVQLGECFDEDDIERLEDDYNRG